jgi:hypothetical protein
LIVYSTDNNSQITGDSALMAFWLQSRPHGSRRRTFNRRAEDLSHYKSLDQETSKTAVDDGGRHCCCHGSTGRINGGISKTITCVADS